MGAVCFGRERHSLVTPEVDIVLATYNGERFLAEQLDSIAEQTLRSWRVLVADDGSSDATLEILARYRHRWGEGKLTVLPPVAGRLGPAASFGRLLAASDADYVCMCDQDDVWSADRLAVTVGRVQARERASMGGPVLVHSDLAVVDERLGPISPSLDRYQRLSAARRTGLRHLLVQNSVTGCTTAMNRPLIQSALPIPSEAVMHDWWLALVAAAFGVVDYEPRALVRYRQHRSNALGARKHGIGRGADLGSMRASLARTYRQAAELQERLGDRMPSAESLMVRRYSEIPRLGPVARRVRVVTDRYFKADLPRTVGMLLVM